MLGNMERNASYSSYFANGGMNLNKGSSVFAPVFGGSAFRPMG
jgi:hypothetical protein